MTTRTPWEDYPDHEVLRLQVTGPHARVLWDVEAHPFIVRWSIPSNAHRLTACVTRIREFATLEEAIAAFRRPFTGFSVDLCGYNGGPPGRHMDRLAWRKCTKANKWHVSVPRELRGGLKEGE